MEDREVGHPQQIAAAWHGVSFVGRLLDFKKKPSRGTAFWLTWELVGIGWSLFNLYKVSSEQIEARLEMKVRYELDRLGRK